MKPYHITIIGTGHAGDENPNAVENRLIRLLQQLVSNGHKIEGAVLEINGESRPLIVEGAELPTPKGTASAQPKDSPATLESVAKDVQGVKALLQRFFDYERKADKKKDGAPEPRKRGEKKEEGGAPPQAQEPGNDSPNPPAEKNEGAAPEGAPPAEETAPQPATDVADDTPPEA